jgi:type VI secretion system protein ImpE
MPMQAEERLRSGNVEEALAELQADVRREPANPQKRVFLFQLLCLLGRWDRALTQLQVLAEMDSKTGPMVQTYGPALKCEQLRREVFAGKRAPLLFGKPEAWMALLLEAARLTGEGKHGEAAQLRDQAFEAAPTTAGTVVVTAGVQASAQTPTNGASPEGSGSAGGAPAGPGDDGAPAEALAAEAPFEWIADGDARLGPMLEVVLKGKYFWVPFMRLKEIRFERPTDLRDLVWAPVTLILANGGETVALVPTRYPGSEDSPDGQIRLARKTTWNEISPDAFLGLGQRVLMTDQGELPLLDIRTMTLAGVDAPAEEQPERAQDRSQGKPQESDG